MKRLAKTAFPLVPVLLLLAAMTGSQCSISYRFNDVTIPDSVKTVKVVPFTVRATYTNTQLAPQLSDKLRQKIVSQTRLKQTSGDNADWEISGVITDYSFSTSGISNNQTSTNRISVAVQVTKLDQKSGATEEYSVSRNFDFPASQTLQQAESSLLSEMIRGLTDDIFNQIFSNWTK